MSLSILNNKNLSFISSNLQNKDKKILKTNLYEKNNFSEDSINKKEFDESEICSGGKYIIKK